MNTNLLNYISNSVDRRLKKVFSLSLFKGVAIKKDISKSFETHFSALKDPRINRKKLYPLIEILFVVLCGSICGAESWRDFVLFGQEKVDFFKQYFPFIHGIPSKNTIARLFYSLNPDSFKVCFIAWMKSLQTTLNEVIAIDGKTLCNSINTIENIPAIHMVSAFATKARVITARCTKM